MFSHQTFNIFAHPQKDDSLQKIVSRTYRPYSRFYGNNDIIEIGIEIVINQSDAFDATYDGHLLLSGKVTKTDDGDVTFVNNAAAFIFSSVTYEINAREVEIVRDVGFMSTM